MFRTSFFIDGFNLYHSILENAPTCKWLNLSKLCSSFLLPSETLSKVHYFTSYTFWNKEKVARHKCYTDALKATGIDVVLGNFKKVTRHCTLCGRDYIAHEEKQTDVNIAIFLFECVLKGECDKVILISGDSDLVPPLKHIKQNFRETKIGVISPIGRKTNELKKASDFFMKLTKERLKECLFPVSFSLNGKTFSAPTSWQK